MSVVGFFVFASLINRKKSDFEIQFKERHGGEDDVLGEVPEDWLLALKALSSLAYAWCLLVFTTIILSCQSASEAGVNISMTDTLIDNKVCLRNLNI